MEAYDYYENWIEKESNNDAINAFSRILFENGEVDKAYAIVRKATWGTACDINNFDLFVRAKQLAEQLKKHNEREWFTQQLEKYHESIHNWEMGEEDIFDEFTAPKQIPVVKTKKYIRMIHAHVVPARNIKNIVGANNRNHIENVRVI